MKNLALLTDLYQLTMLAGYHACNKIEQRSSFELFFRRLPFQGGFCVAAGLEPALHYLRNLRFEDHELEYLKGLGIFSDDFLSWLKNFRFTADVDAVAEGELIFAGEPLMRVRGRLPEAQLVESALLNMLNFQTLIATKAARLYIASNRGSVLEFGLRRAQGVDGAISATRASYIGGCTATSNVLAGYLHGIPVRGTHAHSWIMSFPSELEAFRAYATLYPDSSTLLVDTYDTLGSGVPNAIVVGLELKGRGHQLQGIRLDSGDLAQLSIAARRMLDEAGLEQTKIVASNDLDEHLVANLLSQGARIDIWGVGTSLVTSRDEPALGGVYKLVAAAGPSGNLEPRIKISSNPEKITVPGEKDLWRVYDEQGMMVGDCLTRAGEKPDFKTPLGVVSHHPHFAESRRNLMGHSARALLQPVMRQGRLIPEERPSLDSIRDAFVKNLETLPAECQRRANPESYWVGLSDDLFTLRSKMLSEAQVPRT